MPRRQRSAAPVRAPESGPRVEKRPRQTAGAPQAPLPGAVAQAQGNSARPPGSADPHNGLIGAPGDHLARAEGHRIQAVGWHQGSEQPA